MPERIRVLILAQTNPCISEKYLETVCTAGLREDGSWIRLYPIRGRMLPPDKRYHKYQWIECDIEKPDRCSNDSRPESYKIEHSSIDPKEWLDTSDQWRQRRHILNTCNPPIQTNKETIIQGAWNDQFSLCLFKPSQVIAFTAKNESPDYTDEEKAIMQNYRQQGVLIAFDDEIDPSKLAFRKVPYSFYCEMLDDAGVSMKLGVLDWEMSTNYRNGAKKYTPEEAKNKTLERYNQFILDRDLLFVLGTRNRDHNKLRNVPNTNPWSIISVIPLPKILQMELALDI